MLKRLFARRPSRLDQLQAELDAVKAKSSQYPAWALEMAGVNALALPDPSEFETQERYYQTLSWINIAVNFKAAAGAAQALQVVKVDGEETETIANHPFELLMYHPSPLMSRYELLFGTFAYYALCGNTYWWLNKSTESAEPAEIWLIPPQKIIPIPDEKLYLKGYWYYPGDGSRIFLETWEIAHFHGFNPLGEFLGASSIESIAIIAEGDKAAQKWNTKFFRDGNGKLPSVLAFADNIPDVDWDKIQKDIRANAQKRDMMLLRNVKAGGLQWLQASTSQKDMEFLSGRAATRDEIWNVFAPGLASILSPNATEANAVSGKRTFAEYALYPMLVLCQEKITADILPAYGDNLRAEFDDPRVSDRAMELAEITTYSQTHTVDEVRARWWDDPTVADATQTPDDPRGVAFPAQIGAMPLPGQEQPEQPAAPPSEQPEQEQAETAPEEPPSMPEAMSQELAKWKRRALHALDAGKAATVPFHTNILPSAMVAAVRARLETVTDADAVRAVFENVTQIKPPLKPLTRDAASVLEGLRLAVEFAMKGAPEGHEFYGNQWTGGGGIVFDNSLDARAWGENHSAALYQSLGSSERAALAHYKGEGYEDINNELRMGTFGDYEEDVMFIDSAISQSELKEDIVVFRGTGEDVFNDDDMTGADFVDDGFLSTSLTERGINRYGDITMEIHAPAGVGAFFLDIVGGQSEDELLFARGTKMRILSDTGASSRDRRMVIEVIK